MKKVIIGAVVTLLLAIGVYGMFNIGNSKNTDSRQTFADIQADLASGALLYDVRTPAEYQAGHFENAINFPLGDMQYGSLPQFDKDKKIYVHCQSGNRSGQATLILRQNGFTNIEDLGGLMDVEGIGGKLI